MVYVTKQPSCFTEHLINVTVQANVITSLLQPNLPLHTNVGGFKSHKKIPVYCIFANITKIKQKIK